MKRILVWLAVAAAAFFSAYASAADKPNILFIVSDDTGYGDLGDGSIAIMQKVA